MDAFQRAVAWVARLSAAIQRGSGDSRGGFVGAFGHDRNLSANRPHFEWSKLK
jgi:hypothetical protein